MEVRAREVVAAARVASEAWRKKTPAERAKVLGALGRALLVEADDLAAVVQQETGRPLGESYSADVVGIADLFTYWCRQGPALLAPRKAKIPVLDFPGKTGEVHRDPLGVVAVISPWNYPAATPMRVIVPALLAGNGVVLKPSEHTPKTGAWLVEKLRAHLGPLVGLLPGDGAAGRALIEARPDMVHFTGSTRTGQLVRVRCAELGIPCDVELGGKDCAVVLPDVDLDRAVSGIAWGIVHNAGQDCASIERVAVHAEVAPRFLALLKERLAKIAPEVPGLVTDMQREVVTRQLVDAARRGATFLVGSPEVADGPIPPTLVTDLPRDAEMWREESFGPVAVVEVHDTIDALVDAANDTSFGLGGSVWGRDTQRAASVARRLNVGMAWVNNHAFTGAIPDLPWVGVGASGGGVTNAPEGLMHFTKPRVLVVDRSASPEPWWYPYDESMTALMRAVLERHRQGGVGATVRTLMALSRRNKVLQRDG